jgi:hypothetical protein
MSKKDFIALGILVRDTTRNGEPVFSQTAIYALADFCATQNPLFKRDRWLNFIAGHCGPAGGAK